LYWPGRICTSMQRLNDRGHLWTALHAG
jgi:hypothetical protein